MELGDVGVVWATLPDRQLLYFVVDGGRLADCTPWVARWARRRPLEQLVDELLARRAAVRWAPASAPPVRFHSHLEQVVRLRRWQDVSQAGGRFLTFGQVAGGGWMAEDTAEPHAWRYELEADAVAEVDARRTGGGPWERIPANYGPDGPLPDPEDW